MRPEVIVHHLDQAKAALRAAAALKIDIQLRSDPDAAAAAGVGYLHALGRAVDHEILIDCRADPALAMAAMRAGCRRIAFDGADETMRRLEQMAEARGATLIDRAAKSAPCLELLPEDGEAVVREWLSGLAGDGRDDA